MKLLICTQKVDKDDLILGFFHNWLLEFAKQCEQVTVICLQEGPHSLPANVKVLSLGKEAGATQFEYIKRFYTYVWQERKNYDVVFVHMNPEYVILGGIFWRPMSKKIGLWYTHRQVNLKLRLAHALTHVVFSSAKESFRLQSKKLHVVGHGIDTSFHSSQLIAAWHEPFVIMYPGRATQIKNWEVLLEATRILKTTWGRKFQIQFVGDPSTKEDEVYLANIKKLVKEYDIADVVSFHHNVTFKQLGDFFERADVTVNLCPTGGIDKAVLQSVINGRAVFASNEAYRASPYFGQYVDLFIVKYCDSTDLAEKIIKYVRINTGEEIKELQRRWTTDFGLPKLISKITALLK